MTAHGIIEAFVQDSRVSIVVCETIEAHVQSSLITGAKHVTMCLEIKDAKRLKDVLGEALQDQESEASS